MELTRVPAGSLVVAVDGSARADRALDWAVEQALLEHRVLAVVHVSGSDDADQDGPHAGTTVDPSREPLSTLVLETAVHRVRVMAPGLVLAACSLPGDPRQVLVDMSVASLVVLGARGRGVLRDMPLGSVSSYVSTFSACPTVVVRGAPDGDRRGVVVGADGAAPEVPVLAFAFRYAHRHQLPVTVMHLTGDPTGRDEALSRRIERRVTQLRCEHPEIPVAVELVRGLVDECLDRDQRAWDLVVVGRHPVGPPAGRLAGGAAIAVLERARATVAVVPEALSPDGDLLGHGSFAGPARGGQAGPGYSVE